MYVPVLGGAERDLDCLPVERDVVHRLDRAEGVVRLDVRYVRVTTPLQIKKLKKECIRVRVF